ncbi:unnamed protein product [Adineta ricciae]|uniref:Uncharacterized protein n=1 Tax=Adineta ricciae TaxID=249248 RepID=A0A815VY18_ADIRI|nr:unnamed protein product [Adineta ricciae]CAF1576303.1 unnamed protein product [Adineta ricciae]
MPPKRQQSKCNAASSNTLARKNAEICNPKSTNSSEDTSAEQSFPESPSPKPIKRARKAKQPRRKKATPSTLPSIESPVNNNDLDTASLSKRIESHSSIQPTPDIISPPHPIPNSQGEPSDVPQPIFPSLANNDDTNNPDRDDNDNFANQTNPSPDKNSQPSQAPINHSTVIHSAQTANLYHQVDDDTIASIEPTITDPFRFDFTKRDVKHLLRPPTVIQTTPTKTTIT